MLRELSASQINKYTSCQRRWAFHYLEEQVEPTGEAAAKGIAHHEEMEAFGLTGKVPSSKPALRAMKYAPPPGLAEIEVPVSFRSRHSRWRGFIDFAADWEDGKYRPIASTGWTVIGDYKFTGALRNAKEPTELENDHAVTLYFSEAYLGGAMRVSGRWVYSEMNSSPGTKLVLFEPSRNQVEDNLGKLDLVGAEVQKLYQIRPKTLDLEPNVSQCYAYKKQCPYFEQCKPKRTLTLARSKTVIDPEFKKSVLDSFPGGAPAKKAPPPPPPRKTQGYDAQGNVIMSDGSVPGAGLKKAPPPPPPKKAPVNIDEKWAAHSNDMREPGVPESGFVNGTAPGAPKTAPKTPEEMAEQQNTPPVVEREPDDLDAIEDVNVLKGMAEKLGITVKPRSRAGTYRTAIRLARDVKVVGDVPEGTPGTVTWRGTAADGTKVHETCSVDAPSATQFSHVDNATIAPAFSEQEEYTAYEPGGEDVPIDHQGLPYDFTLCIDCGPANGLTLTVDAIVARANERLGVQDYRQIEYTGAAEMALAVREMFVEGKFNGCRYVELWTNTPEGNALRTTLSSLASLIIR